MKTFKNLGDRIDGILDDIKNGSEGLLIVHKLSSLYENKLKERLLKETFERLEKGKMITPDIVGGVIASDKLVVNDIVSDAARIYMLDYIFESVRNNETKILLEKAQEIYPLSSDEIKTDEKGNIGIMYIPIAMYINEEKNQDIVIFASAIGDFNIAQNEKAAVFAVGITYSDYNDANGCTVWQRIIQKEKGERMSVEPDMLNRLYIIL